MYKSLIRFGHKRDQIADMYTLGLFDSSINSAMALPGDLLSELTCMKDRRKGEHNLILYKRNLAMDAYTFFVDRVKYGSGKRPRGYACAKEVWRNKEGVCGEMSFLYVGACRYLGLRSSYVSVRKDFEGRDVHHACAAVWTPKITYVDLAYQTFDITHQDVVLRNDRDVLSLFSSWREQ